MNAHVDSKMQITNSEISDQQRDCYVWTEHSQPEGEPVVPLPKLLPPGEAEELEACESTIERCMATAIEFGIALQTIRDKRLYRVSFDTWEAYCVGRWKFTARRAQQLCRAAETVRSLALEDANANLGSHFALPASEKHVRPLYSLPLEERRAAWTEAVSSAPAGRVTAKHVADVVRARRVRLGLVQSEERGASERESVERQSVPAKAAWVPREERLRAAAKLAIADVRALLDLAGTADSTKAANLNLALEQLENFHEHLGNIQNLQAARP